MTTTAHQHVRAGVGKDVVLVEDHETAELFRRVHLDQFAAAPNARELVEHFAADHVLLDTSVRAVVVMAQRRPAAVGYLHTTDQVSGIYWVATANEYRRRGHGATVTSALLSLAPTDRPVVLQASTMGRPVYLRYSFRDHGMVWCWALKP